MYPVTFNEPRGHDVHAYAGGPYLMGEGSRELSVCVTSRADWSLVMVAPDTPVTLRTNALA